MSVAALCALALLAETPPSQTPPDRGLADAANEGERDLPKIQPLLKQFAASQPYGKTWLELAKTEPAPKDSTGQGQVKTHEDLKHDTMEVQLQGVYVEPTKTEFRYGTVVIRGMRVFRYGKLKAVRLIHEAAGRPERAKLVADLETWAGAWRDPEGFKTSLNDFVIQKKVKPGEYPLPPLVIELEPQPARKAK